MRARFFCFQSVCPLCLCGENDYWLGVIEKVV